MSRFISTQPEQDERPNDQVEDDEDVSMGDDEPTTTTTTTQEPFQFAPLKSHSTKTSALFQRVSVPPHRMTPLKRDWIKIYTPLVQECKLQLRMNIKRRAVEIKSSKHTISPAGSTIQKAADFINAYCLGFAVDDAIALVRMDDLYIETFEVKDVKMLQGDHLSRAIGRIAGKDGKTRFTIENASKTRIVLADSKIHILGTFSAIKIARGSICNLILGKPPSKVYGNLKTVAARSRQRF